MKEGTRIYKVELYGSPDSIYYLASDINAIFERKFNQRIQNIELVSSLFSYPDDFNDNDTDYYLFYIDYEFLYDKSRNFSKYVVAPTMRDAYNIVYNTKHPKESMVMYSCQCIATINYIKSFDEIDAETEMMRIG